MSNLSSNNVNRKRFRAPGDDGPMDFKAVRKPNAELLMHDKKRAIELQCVELEDRLTEEGRLDADEIEKQVDTLRESLLKKLEKDDSFGLKNVNSLNISDTHQVAKAKQARNEQFAKAFGINHKEHVEGSSFDPVFLVNLFLHTIRWRMNSFLIFIFNRFVGTKEAGEDSCS
jgi:hypothetical protein